MSTDKNRDFIRRVLSPLIAVTCSPELDEICQVNNIPSFVELIKPFGIEIVGKVTIRDSRGQNKSHSNFTVRLRDSKYLEPTSINSEDAAFVRNLSDLIKKHTKTNNILNENNEKQDNFDMREEDKIEVDLPEYDEFAQNLLKKNWSELTPWFDIYKEAFFSTNRIVDHETFDHPVASIIAISAHGPSPIEAMKALYEQNTNLDQLPFIDLERSNSFILVHDSRLGNFEKTQEIYSQLKKSYGNNCHLLVINSRHPTNDFSEVEPTVEDIWTSSINSSKQFNSLDLPLSGPCGQYLSLDDIESIQSLIKKIVIETILPFMERKMHFLNEQVASSRRGFTGRLFSASRRYFGTGKPLSPTNSTTTGSSQTSPNSGLGSPTFTQYQFSSSEAQLRKLADIAFMLRDYDFARNTYETVKKDFQADNAWRFYSGTQEMIGLCLLFSEGSGSRLDVERYYDKPIHYYLSLKMPTWAARCALLYLTMFKYHHRYRDIPKLLVRLTGEESDIKSALFLEQTAFGYLKTSPPRIRKFAFHLILAGHKFNSCNQRAHAYRCYNMASKIFCANNKIQDKSDVLDNGLLPIKKWNYIEDHINFSLGRQSLRIGELNQAIFYFSSLLIDSKKSQAAQAGYMKEFIYIYKSYASSINQELMLEKKYCLPIPEINVNEIDIKPLVTNELNQEDNNLYSKLIKESIDNNTKPILANGIITDAHSKFNKYEAYSLNEPLNLNITLYNPLKISIKVSNFKLDYNFEGQDKAEGLEVEVVENQLLDSFSTTLISFKLIPKKHGILNIKGMYYTLNDVVSLYKSFELKGPRLNNTPQQRKGHFYGINYKFLIYIAPALPKLHIELLDLPQNILSGEVIQRLICIKNVGHASLDWVKIKLSHPTFFCFGKDQQQDYKSTNSLYIDNNISDLSEVLLISKNDINNDINISIEPGNEIMLPVFIRGDRIGNHNFYFLIKYGIENMKQSNLECRIEKMSLNLIVQPSLKINAFTRQSAKTLDSFLLGIEVENVQAYNSFNVTQLTSISNNWHISDLNSELNNSYKDTPDISINPRQSTFLYFSISKVNQSEKNELENNSVLNEWLPEVQMATSLQALTTGLKEFDEYKSLEMNYTNFSLTNSPKMLSESALGYFYNASRNQNRISGLSKEMASIDLCYHNQIFPLYLSNDIDLTLFWDATENDSTSKRSGCHHIIGINFGINQNPLLDFSPLVIRSLSKNKSDDKDKDKDNELKLVRSLFETTAKEKTKLITSLIKNPKFKNDNPAKVIMKVPEFYYHDFSSSPLATLKVQFHIKNCSWNREMDISLHLLDTTVSTVDNTSSNILKTHVKPIPMTSNTHSRKSSRVSNSPSTRVGLEEEVHKDIEVISNSHLATRDYYWSDSQTFDYKILPNDIQIIDINVCFTRPGTFNLNLWKIDIVAHAFNHGNINAKTFLKFLNDNTMLDKPLDMSIHHTFTPQVPYIVHVLDKK